MGWLFALGLAALTYLALMLSRRCSQLALQLAGAAILVALAGYAWQGKPGMLGHPAAHQP
jgi:cytochrome c-type biogenesis protein CcmH